MHTPRYFDYLSAAREAGLSGPQLDRLLAALRIEEPTDDMMFELHALRACMAMVEGPYSFEEIIEPIEQANRASAA